MRYKSRQFYHGWFQPGVPQLFFSRTDPLPRIWGGLIPQIVVIHTKIALKWTKKLKMNNSDRKKVIAINAILIAVLYGLVSFNKEVLRPAFNNSSLLKILTGCFPNFIAALLISLAPIVGVLFRKPEKSRLIVYISSLLIFLVLTVEEFKPMWGASTYFDVYDIIASGLGSGLAIVIFEIIQRQKRQFTNKN